MNVPGARDILMRRDNAQGGARCAADFDDVRFPLALSSRRGRARSSRGGSRSPVPLPPSGDAAPTRWLRDAMLA